MVGEECPHHTRSQLRIGCTQTGAQRELLNWQVEHKLKVCTKCGNPYAPEPHLTKITRQYYFLPEFFNICPSCRQYPVVDEEKCLGCGECVLSEFGGVCPVTRCAKHMLNGPCSGSREDRCEVSPTHPCAWQLIYQRLKGINELDRLKKVRAPKNWSAGLSGGNRIIIREDHRL